MAVTRFLCALCWRRQHQTAPAAAIVRRVAAGRARAGVRIWSEGAAAPPVTSLRKVVEARDSDCSVGLEAVRVDAQFVLGAQFLSESIHHYVPLAMLDVRLQFCLDQRQPRQVAQNGTMLFIQSFDF